MNSTRPPHLSGNGLLAGLAAYVAWGFMPLLFHALDAVPPFEVVAWRVVFSLPLCLLFTGLGKGWGDLARTLRQPRLVLRLVASALLIATNWTIYVTAVVHGHVLATSLGYYINPLINVLIGTLFLHERLGWRQWAAVALAGLGIALLMIGAVQMLGTALLLAVSFALYGLVRKLTPVPAITGLTVETLVLYPVAAVWVVLVMRAPHGSSIALGGWTAVLLVGTGLTTTVPLILFAVAARSLPLSSLGFLQFTAPTIVFLVGVALGEALSAAQLACFVLIWIAVALFVWDLWRRTRYLNRPAAS
jgi:chloramphenicol-sensitive protein RarD